MSAGRKVGVSDVAQRAGVSIGTVSNYLNYPERVSDTLKSKIGRAIEDLGYVPRRSMPTPTQSTPDTPLVGYVMTDIEHSLFTSIFEGIQEVCEDNGMQTIGLNASSDLERQHDLIRTLITMNVAGIVLSTVQDGSEDVAAAREAGIPIILIDHTNPYGYDQVCSILENNVSVGRVAAEELIRTGCRHIAFASHSFDYESIQDRLLGVRKAVRDAGSGITFELIDSGGIMVEDGRQLGLDLSSRASASAPAADGDPTHVPDATLKASDDAPRRDNDGEGSVENNTAAGTMPDGIVAGSDALAMGILIGLAEKGTLHVPDDISVIGTEGMWYQSISPMPLTVMQAPGIAMGRKAMEQMLDYIENPVSHVHGTMLIEPTLVRRASTRH